MTDPRIDETPVEIQIYGEKRMIPKYVNDYIGQLLEERHQLRQRLDSLLEGRQLRRAQR